MAEDNKDAAIIRAPTCVASMISNRTRVCLALALAIPLITWSYQKYTRHTLDNYVVCSKFQKIYTVDESKPNATCISIQNTHIVAVGGLGNIHH